MTKITLTAALAMVALAGLSGCGEKPQTLGAKKVSTPSWSGTDGEYSAPGWKAGDQQAWEKQITHRAQGQDEYVRINTGAQ